MTDEKHDHREVSLSFDTGDTKGIVALVEGIYGPTITVNGQEIGYIDLFQPTEGGPPQLLIFDHRVYDEILVKVVLKDTGMEVVVNGDTVDSRSDFEIHSDNRDHVYVWGDGVVGDGE